MGVMDEQLKYQNITQQFQNQSLNLYHQQSALSNAIQGGLSTGTFIPYPIPHTPIDLYPTKAHRKWAKKEGQVMSFKEALKREIELWHGDVLEV